MLISEKVEIKWNPKNKKRFVELGYDFTKMKDVFSIKVEHLSKYSRSVVKYKCDYCGELHNKTYDEFLRQKKITDKDCCNNATCKNKKLEDSVLEKYGETNISKTDYFNEKYRSTMNENYGVDNYFNIIDNHKDNNHEWKDTNITCDQCGIVKHRKESHINKYKNNFCSIKCKGLFSRTDLSMFDYKYPRSTVRYKEWRLSVFTNDNFKCKICGSENKLEAHHVTPIHINPELIFDIDNGSTLCEVHHNAKIKNSFHNLYGTRNNNKNQLLEYIERCNSGEFRE